MSDTPRENRSFASADPSPRQDCPHRRRWIGLLVGSAIAPFTLGLGGASGAAAPVAASTHQAPAAAASQDVPEAYQGILAYLDGQAASGDTAAAPRAAEIRHRLAAGEDVLGSLRGKQIWAYRSRVDGTAQPFTAMIPPAPKPGERWLLRVDLHGGGATHEVQGDWTTPGVLRVSVLGHGRSARYRGLSEVDVRDVIDYCLAHWPVDSRRMVLNGFSLGGAGSFTLASRHPDWFAGVGPAAGWGIAAFPENLTTVPLVAQTSRDDVAIHPFCRAAIQAICKAGGRASHVQMEGLGHGWSSDLGLLTEPWLVQRPPLRMPDRFEYTAEDEAARGAWGVEVSVWGDAPHAASFTFRREKAHLRITTDNVQQLRVVPSRCGVTPQSPPSLEIDQKPVAWPEPLPSAVLVTRTATGWTAETESAQANPPRAHFPGGLDSLLHGGRVAVVYGTQGPEVAVRAREKLAAEVAKLPVAAVQNNPARMHGHLPVFTDTQLTDSMLQEYDLIVIGDAQENAFAQRIAPGMTAKIAGGRVEAAGESWAYQNATVGVLGQNPLAPSRLVYWIVSDGPQAYQLKELPFKLLGYDTRPALCPDLMIAAHGEDRLIAARRLTGQWKWCIPSRDERALPEGMTTPQGLAQLRAGCLRRASGSEAGLALWREPEKGFRVYPAATASVSRIEDVACLHGADRILILEPTGKELKTLLSQQDLGLCLEGIKTEGLEDSRRYRVACIAADCWAILRILSNPDLPLELTRLDVGNAIRSHAKAILEHP